MLAKSKMSLKLALITIAILLGIAIAMELGLRLLFGFGNPPLYVADEEVGYLLAPNQNLRRMGNRIQINEYSMRNGAIAATPAADTYRILMVGDSILNGNWWTSQEKTLTEVLERQLQPEKFSRQRVEVLNASANSWGPRNEVAYIRKFGTFGAQVVVLLLNTDDLFAKAPFSGGVGSDRNYPNQKPPLAIVEVWQLLVSPPTSILTPEESGDRVGNNLEAMEEAKAIVQQNNAEFWIAMTPLLREIGDPGTRDYELRARKRLQEFAEKQDIPYIDFLPIFNAASSPEELYRDHIHLSPAGNKLVSEVLARKLQSGGGS